MAFTAAPVVWPASSFSYLGNDDLLYTVHARPQVRTGSMPVSGCFLFCFNRDTSAVERRHALVASCGSLTQRAIAFTPIDARASRPTCRVLWCACLYSLLPRATSSPSPLPLVLFRCLSLSLSSRPAQKHSALPTEGGSHTSIVQKA